MEQISKLTPERSNASKSLLEESVPNKTIRILDFVTIPPPNIVLINFSLPNQLISLKYILSLEKSSDYIILTSAIGWAYPTGLAEILSDLATKKPKTVILFIHMKWELWDNKESISHVNIYPENSIYVQLYSKPNMVWHWIQAATWLLTVLHYTYGEDIQEIIRQFCLNIEQDGLSHKITYWKNWDILRIKEIL